MEDGSLEDEEAGTPRRPRRRAVRPAGPVSGNPSGQASGGASGRASGRASGSTTPVLDKPMRDTPVLDTPVLDSPVLGGVPIAADDSHGAVSSIDTQADGDPPVRTGRRRSVVLTAVFVVVLLAVVAAGVYLFLGLRASSAEDARAERFVQTARQTVLNLTTIHPDSAQADVDRLLAGASGDFKAEFEGREGPFVEVVQQARVDSNGEIIEAGMESSGDDYAEILVAARAMVQNSDVEEAQPRDFRLRVRIADDDGVMTASRVEFVP